MARRWLAIVGALGLMVTACGDDGPEPYYEGLRDAIDAYVTDVDELPVASTSGTIEDAQAFFAGMVDELEQAVAALEKLAPPEDAQVRHSVFLDRVSDFSDLAGGMADHSQSLETTDDLIAMGNDPVFGVANFRAIGAEVVAACEDLQDVIDTQALEVALECHTLDTSN